MKVRILWLLLALLTLPGTALSRPPPLDFALAKTDIADVTESADDGSLTLRFSEKGIANLQTFADANPGKRLRLVYEEATLVERFEPDSLDGDAILLESLSDEAQKAIKCWKDGCPDPLVDDAECD